MSGALSVFLGALALGAVLCLHFPALLTSPELRAVYPMPVVRAVIQGGIVVAFACGAWSAWRGRRRGLGLLGMGLAVLATWLGGAHVPVETPVAQSPYLGLDWFLISLLLTAVVFVPIERAFPLRREQALLRPEWTIDLAWFFASHALVQVLSLLVVLPARVLVPPLQAAPVQAAIAAIPVPAQFVLILLILSLIHI